MIKAIDTSPKIKIANCSLKNVVSSESSTPETARMTLLIANRSSLEGNDLESAVLLIHNVSNILLSNKAVEKQHSDRASSQPFILQLLCSNYYRE